MKTTIKFEKEVDIQLIKIDIAPRYIGDGEDDDVPTSTPMLTKNKDAWIAFVEVDTGKIQDWPEGQASEIYAKVCDAGIYSLFDEKGELVKQISGYVPNGIVPGEYGDYVDLKINEKGVITNWPKTPSFEEFFED